MKFLPNEEDEKKLILLLVLFLFFDEETFLHEFKEEVSSKFSKGLFILLFEPILFIASSLFLLIKYFCTLFSELFTELLPLLKRKLLLISSISGILFIFSLLSMGKLFLCKIFSLFLSFDSF